ncbi:thioester reductase domain protein [Rippkaea orientalis PCC 8801]|uniref:Thioester reductase domain protein n=1 Tax=Rippkaea orientalis (strain PCC 8801 / RF-1) TaxID=41431 RepID=B7K2V7_RIPO1|nr:thioester reductase domain-containing protein [Rippkaea orientalis]ACK67658.1 thioester reductase domain protein [Rippkaea orientalis PCC 8801]
MSYSLAKGNLNREAYLDPSIQYLPLSPFRQRTKRRAFLTGATGFLGANLLHDLLKHTLFEVYCLVRASNADEGKVKLRQALKAQNLWMKAFEFRIHPVVGDLSKPQLGLSDAAFASLGKQIEVIYHNASWLNLSYPYSTLKATNVKGTEEILRLAAIKPQIAVHYVSTLSVFSPRVYNNQSEIAECFWVQEPIGLQQGYPQSKWVAEQLINIGSQRGLFAWIYRPGMITGHSETGICNNKDKFSILLRTCLELGLVPEFKGTVYMTPVDYVSRSIIELSELVSETDQAFHLITPQPMSWTKVVKTMLDTYPTMNSMPYSLWFKEVQQSARQSVSQELRTLVALLFHPTIPPFSTNQDVQFSCENTMKVLSTKFNIEWTQDNPTLLRRYLSYLAEVPSW